MQTMLDAAVPLWIMEMRETDMETVKTIAAEAGEVLGKDAEYLMHKKEGKTASAFNATAKGIAVLSFMPGGVKAFERHWESKFKPRRERL